MIRSVYTPRATERIKRYHNSRGHVYDIDPARTILGVGCFRTQGPVEDRVDLRSMWYSACAGSEIPYTASTPRKLLGPWWQRWGGRRDRQWRSSDRSQGTPPVEGSKRRVRRSAWGAMPLWISRCRGISTFEEMLR